MTSEHVDFWGKLSRGAASKGNLVQRARPKLAWNKALWNLCRVDGIASASPSRSAAVKPSELLMQTQLPYPSQLVFNLKFIKPCRKGRWNLQSILYRCCDNFNLKSNLKVGNALDTFFLLVLFPLLLSSTSVPLRWQSSNNVAAALSLSSRPLMIYGLQQERSPKQDDHCIWMGLLRAVSCGVLETARDEDSSSCPIAWLAPSVLCILHRTAQAARPWARITKDRGVLSRAWSKACCSIRTGVSKTDRHH